MAANPRASRSIAAAVVVVGVGISAQTSASVVEKIGVDVSGTGPQVVPSQTTDAPAAAPTANWYTSSTAKSQSSLPILTLVMNSATLAKIPASAPTPTSSRSLMEELYPKPASSPIKAPIWSTAFSSTSAPSIVTGKNSNWPPSLQVSH